MINIDFKNTKYLHIAIPVFVVLLLINLFLFTNETFQIVSKTNKNNFIYTIKVRNAVEEIDKIVERAELNLNLLEDTISLAYDPNKINSKEYNLNALKSIDFLIKSSLINTPGVDGAWFQLNINLPFALETYSWYEYENNKIVNVKARLDKEGLSSREITPETDPYYFEAISAKKMIWTDIYKDFDIGREMLTIATPVRRDGHLIGVVGIDISVDDLQLALKNMQSAFDGSEIFLLDENHNVILEQLLVREKKYKESYSFLDLFSKQTSKENQMVEYVDNGIHKTAILLDLSNKYNVVITFSEEDVFRGFQRLFGTIYSMFFILVILIVIIFINKQKITKINKELENEVLIQKTIINSAPSIMIIKNRNGVILECNDKFLEVAQKTREEVIGKTVDDFFDSELAIKIKNNDKMVLDSKKIFIDEERLIDKNGEEIYLKTYKVPLFDNNKEVKGLLVNSLDITRLKQEQELLKKAKDCAEEATEMKSNFLANMSHEIRTPLNGVLGFLQLLEDTEVNDLQKEFIADAQKSSELLLNIINEILDFSKIEAGKLQIDNISFNIRSAVEDVAIISTACAIEKGLDLNTLICSDVPERVMGDPGRFKQILNNLVGNAIKFTKDGEVIIYVKMISETDDEAIVSFEVRDTGIGISQDKLNLIFESFTQADPSTTRRFGGTGLGLAISKKLAALMNGSITAESKEQEGSVFKLTIPFKKDKNINNQHQLPDKILHGENILVVNNNPTDLRILNYYLSGMNCIIREAHSAKDALKLMSKETNNISVVLIDYNMQSLEDSEEELSILLKKGEFSKDIPLILYTNLAKRGDSIIAKEKGFNGYLTKPLKRNELIDAITFAIKDKKDGISDNFVTKHLIKEHKFDSKSKILVVEDCEINCKLILRILNNFGLYCDVATDGADAVKAFESGKYDIILMDCEMPIMDGYEATKRIREIEEKNAADKCVPIIAMTANVLNSDKDKCLNAGMDNYISKPIKIDALETMLREYIEFKKESIEPLEDMHSFEYAFNELRKELELTKKEAIELFTQYREILPKTIVEMESAIENDDFETLKKVAHKLKGSSANMRIERIAQLGEKIECEIRDKDKSACMNTINEIKKHLNCLNELSLPSEDDV